MGIRASHTNAILRFGAILLWVSLLVLVVGVGIGLGPTALHTQTTRRCFAETGLCITGRIYEFWEQNGGLPVFGLPITPQYRETIEGQAVQVQWFERTRLELHPEHTRPYDVMIGRVGVETLQQQQSAQHIGQQTLATTHPSDQECRFFATTRHSVCGDILAAWQANGLELDGTAGLTDDERLALTGLPITDLTAETLSDGKTYQVQWFERARLELHPELALPYQVQYGLLGNELRAKEQRTWPRFDLSDCPFHVPDSVTVTCGYLSVPEDRQNPDSRTIQLAVAVVPSNSATPLPDPVVYLSGGPGSPALVNTIAFSQGWSWFLEDRDFVVLDQRGTGFSRPALLCPESSQLTRDLMGQEHTHEEKVRAEIDTALQCRDRLVQSGVDLAGYTSAASAADLNDLRLALGYDQWNLMGISYGTRLALTAMRDYPEGIRSVILDSTYPLQVNLFTDMPANLDRSLRTLFDNCVASPTCSRSYPDLETVFYTLVTQLDAGPVTVWPVLASSGQAVKVRVDGAELLNLMFRSFYDTGALPLLPQMIYETHNGTYETLTRLEQRQLGRQGGAFSHGAYFSVECSEEIAFATSEVVTATMLAYPRLRPFFAGIPENTTEIFRLCQAWGVRQPAPVENEPVTSDIPTLILAGEYDPITPPTWARLAAQTLRHSSVYEFPNTGHAVITRGACPQSLIRQFLDNLSLAPDGGCVGK